MFERAAAFEDFDVGLLGIGVKLQTQRGGTGLRSGFGGTKYECERIAAFGGELQAAQQCVVGNGKPAQHGTARTGAQTLFGAPCAFGGICVDLHDVA